MTTSDVQDSYNRVASEYAKRIYDELRHKPFDRKMLDWLIEKTSDRGPICDMGCGPGQVARYLYERGAKTCGLDLSPEMVSQASLLNPGIPFQQGNMLSLTGVPDAAYGGIAAFYTLLHIPHAEMGRALAEFRRVLVPGGPVLITFHLGKEIKHLEEWWGEKVSIDFMYFEREEMKAFLQAAGFLQEEAIERDPYPEVEVQTRRAYIFARAPQ